MFGNFAIEIFLHSTPSFSDRRNLIRCAGDVDAAIDGMRAENWVGVRKSLIEWDKVEKKDGKLFWMVNVINNIWI